MNTITKTEDVTLLQIAYRLIAEAGLPVPTPQLPKIVKCGFQEMNRNVDPRTDPDAASYRNRGGARHYVDEETGEVRTFMPMGAPPDEQAIWKDNAKRIERRAKMLLRLRSKLGSNAHVPES